MQKPFSKDFKSITKHNSQNPPESSHKQKDNAKAIPKKFLTFYTLSFISSIGDGSPEIILKLL
jgi:hypothetical protein